VLINQIPYPPFLTFSLRGKGQHRKIIIPKISQNDVIDRLNLLEKLIPEYQSIADEFMMLDNTNIK